MSDNPRKTQRRVLLAMLGSSAASLVIAKVASSQIPPVRPRVPSSNRRNVPVVTQIKLSPERLQQISPAAKRLTGNDLQLLSDYKFTSRTQDLTFRDLSSLVQALERQYGATNTIVAAGRTSSSSCCCCCCCCECFWCEDTEITSPDKEPEN